MIAPIDSRSANDAFVTAEGEEAASATEMAETKSRSLGRTALRPRADLWPLYAIVSGFVLLVFGRGIGTHGLLAGWTLVGATMIAWPLINIQAALRRRLIAGAAALLAVLLVAWRLDALPNLGVLALTGNLRAMIVVTLLAAVLGALTGSRRWIVVQTGVWCIALAGSGWWLLLQPDSRALLSEWRHVLPAKLLAHFVSSIPQPFDSADAILLSVTAAGLFATSAFAGLQIRRIATEGVRAIPITVGHVLAYGAWLVVLLDRNDDNSVPIAMLLVMLAALAGATARSLRELAPFPVALASAGLTYAALATARDGLLSWWGPIYYDDFLFDDFTPSRESLLLIAGYVFLLVVAAIAYLGGRLISKLGRKASAQTSVASDRSAVPASALPSCRDHEPENSD